MKVELDYEEIEFLKRYGLNIKAPVKSNDIIALLPKKVNGCSLKTSRLPNGEWGAYYEGEMEYDSMNIEEFRVEALYELLIWCYKFGHLKANKI